MDNFDLIAIAKQHLKDIEDGKSGEELIAPYFSHQAVQVELPNKLNVNGGTSNYSDLIERSKKGKHIIVQQSYTVMNEFISGNTVILEVLWKGVFTIPVGNTPPGGTIKAHFAMFMEFEEGKIVKQRNYDCFEPF